jgi:hypothetical protein
MSIFYSVESIAVGVEINRIMKIVNACRIIRLKINNPRLDPPIFFHIISIGSLARFINSTSSLIYCYIYASSSSYLINVDYPLSLSPYVMHYVSFSFI